MFSDAYSSDVQFAQDATQLHIRWVSTAPAGWTWQVYVGRALSWHGSNGPVTVPTPHELTGIAVVAVPAGEATTDWSGSLAAPGGTGDRADLTWLGGTYLDATGGDDVS